MSRSGDGNVPGEGGPRVPELPPFNDADVRREVEERADTVRVREPGETRRPARIVARKPRGERGRVAVIDGCRTPFCKAGTDLAEMDVVDLAGAAAAELMTRGEIPESEVDSSIFGVVVPALHAPNLGREVVFRAGLPMEIPGTTVNLACASSNRAITSGAEAIVSGQCEVVLAGGSESLSNVPIRYSKSGARRLMELNKARSLGDKLKVLSRVRLRDLVPVPPAIAEHTTGMTMGQACEKMARENEISRAAQDELALLSHHRAAVATAEGRLDSQRIAAFPPPGHDRAVSVDNGVRADSTAEALAALKPVFDRRYGTLTAGNSSPITDGGAAVILTSEAKARELGVRPLGYIRSWAYAALDPGDQLLQGPAYAGPAALDAAGVGLDRIDLVEMHEAFAAQVISNLKAFASPSFARVELDRAEPVGVVDLERLNVNGGSIAIGHPFGATGARVTMQLLFELRRRGASLGLMTVCAAGGVGFSMVVETE